MTPITNKRQKQDRQLADYTDGSILGSILKMGIPSMLGFLSQNIYTLVDIWWVSKLEEGEAAVAALTFFGAILMFLFSFNQLVGPGSVAVISRRYGEKRYNSVEKAIKETLLLKLLIGFLFGVLGFYFAEDLLYMVGARGESLTMAVDYASIMFISLGLPFAMYSVFTALRSIANPQMSMILMVASNILNLVLDPILMFGWLGMPAMGIKGAAIASVISFAITFGVGLWILYAGRANVRLHLSGKEAISFPSMWRLLQIGFPAWIGSLSFSGSRLVIAPLVATFGTSVIAAYGVGMEITGFGIMVVVGIGLGLSSLIGHNLGQDKSERAKKTGNQAILLSLGIMVAFGVAIYFLAGKIMGLFFDSAETVAHGVTMLRILSLAFPALGVFLMVEEIHMGVGLNAPMMVFSIIHSWGLQVIPIVLAVTLFAGTPVAVWWIITISINLSTIAVFIYYLRGRWLVTRV